MKCLLLLTLLVAGLGVQMSAAEGPSYDKLVADAVRAFDPLWYPPRDGLRGLRIGVDPAWPTNGPDLAVDTSLFTTLHLYHAIHKSGASPVLTRADNTRIHDETAATLAHRTRRLADANCDAAVYIRYATDQGSASVAALGGPADAAERFAAALRSALTEYAGLEVKAAEAARALANAIAQTHEANDLPIVVVVLPVPAQQSTWERREAAMEHARAIYEGLQDFLMPTKVQDVEPSPEPDCPPPDTSSRLLALGRRIHSDGPLPNDKLQWFIDEFERRYITNHTLVFFDIAAEPEGDTVVLRGRTNFPILVQGLRGAFEGAGRPSVRSAVTALPNREALGDRLFGVCRVVDALTFNRPRDNAGLQTQLLLGEPVFLLDRTDSHYLLHASDGYWGWVRREAIRPMTEAEFDEWSAHPLMTILHDFTLDGVRVPRGAVLPATQTTATECKVMLPTGGEHTLPNDEVATYDARLEDAQRAVRAALKFAYVPYVFGGRSPMGLDCSGFVTNVWAQKGVKPPRDAWQQALAGRLVATPWHMDNLRAGDQLFFMNARGKTYHTGIALNSRYFIHSSGPCVQISSFDPNDPLHDDEYTDNFLMGKRP